jgi:predicted nucleic-acid-binding Zn-ribbon protein
MSTPPKDPNEKQDATVAGATAKATASVQSEEQDRFAIREKYAATLRRLWIEPDNCPICGSNAWNIGDLIQTPLRELVGRSAVIAQLASLPQAYVYVPVSCVICGYTMFFHSGVLDVRDEEEVKAVPPVLVLPERGEQ